MRIKSVIVIFLFSLLFCNTAFALSDSVVVFNEIMYHPEVNEAELEWVEVYNQMSVNIDMSGWSIRGGIKYDFPQGTVIPADGYLVVAVSPTALEAAIGYADAYGPFEGRLSNDGEELRLRNNNKRVMDVVDYRDGGSWPVGPDGFGVSLSKYSQFSAGDVAENWRSSSSVGGTPGLLNFQSSAPYIYQYDTFLTGEDPVKFLIPSNSSVDAVWRESSFNDSGWTSGVTSVGHDLSNSFIANFALNKPVINGSGAYNWNPYNVGDFTALNVTDGSTSDIYGTNYWLGSDGVLNEYFILDLGSAIPISLVSLRNTHNAQWNDRGTENFEIWASNEIDVSNELVSPQLILSGSLSNVNGLYPIPADVFTEANGLTLTTARYLKFIALTANNVGNNVGLNEIEVYGNLVNTDIENLMYTHNSTAYFRLPFTVNNPQQYDQLTLSLQYDDGFVAYLNGTKVLAKNAPASLSWDSVATAEHSDNEAVLYESHDISAYLNLLESGDNVLAIHGLNISASDDDFLMASKLTARQRQPLSEAGSSLIINEISAAGTSPFLVELYNYGQDAVNLNGYGLRSSGGGEISLSGIVVAGGYISIDTSDSGFVTNLGDKLFLYVQGANLLIDAVAIKTRLKGHLPGEPHSSLQYPSQATFGSVNIFDLSSEIVINEIMYHHRPEYAIAGDPSSYVYNTLVAFDDSWKYDQSGDDLGTGWKETTYNDLGWPSGPGVLGLEPAPLTEPIQTALTVSSKITYYFRTDFEFSGDLQDATLQLTTEIDDGAIFYLNGVEVYRTPTMPAGTVDYQTLSGSVGNATVAGPFTIPHASLVVGTNVLAVEVHQTSTNSSDIVFGMQLDVLENTASLGTPYAEIDEEWIELYNHSNQVIDIGGWKLDEAVDYEFPLGTTMAAGEYLVVAKDALTLQTKYPAIRIMGDYSGKLSNDNERIILLDSNGNTADNVHYYSNGKWPKIADGGGSSLELRDPLADNANGQAWAGSDEQLRSAWQHYTYTAVASSPVYDPAIYFHEFVLGLLDSGEILLDNVSVIENPDTDAIELMQNVNFDNDAPGQWPNKWRIQGTHDRSVVIIDPDDSGNKVLHLIADGPSNYLCNHAETTLANGQTVVNGNTYKISFDAKWISGSPQLRAELYYCDVAKTNIIEMPSICGTPGQQNSTYESNIGPTYSGLRHEPLIPSSSDIVTISIKADDSDGVSSMILWYSVAGGSWNGLSMTDIGDGIYTSLVLAKSNSTIVQFYVEGRDSFNKQSFYPAGGQDSRALYKVDDGFAVNSLRRDFRFVMHPDDASFLHLDTNMLSNNRLGATVVYNNQEVFYDVGVRLKGSMFSRADPFRIGYNLRFQPDYLFRGVHDTVTLRAFSRNELLPKHLINQSGGLPGMYDDIVNLTTPTGLGAGPVAMSMARYGDIFLDSQYDNGKDGTVFKMEGIRVMQLNRPAEDLKIYKPIGWMSGFDLADLGDDKELYRWVIKINRNRSKDDYSRIIDMCKMFSLTGSELQQAAAEVLDVDEWMRKFALMSLFGINDIYTQGNPHNLNFYVRPSDNKVLAMPWDWDHAFSHSTYASLWGNKNLSKVISLPIYNRLFLGHLHDMINTTYNTTYMTEWVSHYSQVSGLNLNSKLSYIDARAAYVLGQMPAFVPFEITTNGGLDFTVDDDAATIAGRGWINVREIYLNDDDNPLDVEWLDHENWQVTIPLEFGANVLNLTVHDFRGNVIATDSITVTSTVDERPLRDNLRVTELMYDPVGGSDFEYIELYNAGANAIDISNVSLIEVGGEGIIFDFVGKAISSLSPNEYVLIVKDLAVFSSRYDTTGLNIAGEYSGKLSNGGEKITIHGQWGSEVLSFDYADGRSWPLAADGAGHSLVPLDSVVADQQSTGSLDYGGNWRASTYIYGSPGRADPVGTALLVLNEIMAHTDYENTQQPEYDSNDWIELYNSTSSPVTIQAGKWYLSDSKDQLTKWAIPETTVPAHGFVSFDEVSGFHNPITQGFGLDKAGEQVYLSYLSGTSEDRVVDCIKFKAQENGISLGRLPDGSNQWHVMSPSRNLSNSNPVEHIIICEFMYHPLNNSFEYIMLYNPGMQPVALWDDETNTGWRIDGGVSFDFDRLSAIPADSYLFIAGFDPNEANLEAFELEYGSVPANIAGTYTGSLSNGGERIALEKPQASDDPTNPEDISWIIVDEVTFSDRSPWPVEADGLGKALRRKSITSYGNSPLSWFAALPMSDALSGDFNADGIVDLLDFSMFSDKWLTDSDDANWDQRYELYQSFGRQIDIMDFLTLSEQWLSVPSN
jgi:hypothetical protein